MRSQPNHNSRYDEKTTVYEEDFGFSESSMLEPTDRAATSSSNYISLDHNNIRRSLLIDDDNTRSEAISNLPLSQQNIIKRNISVKKNKQHYFDCCQLLGTIWAFIKIRMAFKPPVPDDPRLLSPAKKRIILACLACGSSLNGFCSTVYVCSLYRS